MDDASVEADDRDLMRRATEVAIRLLLLAGLAWRCLPTSGWD